jgi:hypothetical protein
MFSCFFLRLSGLLSLCLVLIFAVGRVQASVVAGDGVVMGCDRVCSHVCGSVWLSDVVCASLLDAWCLRFNVLCVAVAACDFRDEERAFALAALCGCGRRGAERRGIGWELREHVAVCVRVWLVVACC